MQIFWALGTAFKINFVIDFITIMTFVFFFVQNWPFPYPRTTNFSLFFPRSWKHKKHVNFFSEINLLEAHIWPINWHLGKAFLGLLKAESSSYLPMYNLCFFVVRDLKPSNSEGPGNLLSLSNINGQHVKLLLQQL